MTYAGQILIEREQRIKRIAELQRTCTRVEVENAALRAKVAELQRRLDLAASDASLDSPGYHHQAPSDERKRY